jgi:HEAT repeat protein
LTHALKDADPTVREAAAVAVGRVGSVAESAVPALIAALHDAEPAVAFQAAEALGRIGKASVHPVTQKLNDSNLQLLAATVLASIGPDGAEAVPALTKLIHSKDPHTSREALLALGSIGPQAKQSSAEVIAVLNDSKSADRAAAAFALGKMKSPDAVAPLKAVLEKTEDPTLQLSTATALLEIDPHEQNLHLALPKLSMALNARHHDLRIEAAAAIGRIGPPARPTLHALRRALKDDHPDVRTEVLLAMAAIGPESRPAVPDIVAQLDDPSPEMREVVCHALGRIGHGATEAVPALQKLSHSRNRDERTDALWALVLIAPDAESIKQAIPLLAGLLQSTDPDPIRADAAATLGKIGSHSDEARHALQAALKDSSEVVRKAAEKSLDKLK